MTGGKDGVCSVCERMRYMYVHLAFYMCNYTCLATFWLLFLYHFVFEASDLIVLQKAYLHAASDILTGGKDGVCSVCRILN